MSSPCLAASRKTAFLTRSSAISGAPRAFSVSKITCALSSASRVIETTFRRSHRVIRKSRSSRLRCSSSTSSAHSRMLSWKNPYASSIRLSGSLSLSAGGPPSLITA